MKHVKSKIDIDCRNKKKISIWVADLYPPRRVQRRELGSGIILFVKRDVKCIKKLENLTLKMMSKHKIFHQLQ